MIGPAASALLAEAHRRPGRVLLTGLAILVATVFAAGTLLLSESLRDFVAEQSQVTPVAAAAVVLPEELTGDPQVAALVERAAAVPGVAQSVGVWAGAVTVSGAGATSVWELTSDPMVGPLTRLPALDHGTLPAAADEMLVGRGTAARTGLVPGATLTLAPESGPPRTVTVTGVVEVPDGVNTLVGQPAAVADLGGGLQQLDLAADPGTDPAELVARVGAAISAPQAVRTGEAQRAAEARDASGTVTAMVIGVGVFAGLAMVAAAVVVASTFRIVLTQRRTQLALLRCVGARRGQVLTAVLVEAAVSGLVAGVLGVAVAVLAGYGVIAAMTALGVADPPALALPWPGLVGCVLIALLTTVASALAPALAAARIPPVAALGTAAAGESGAPRVGRRLWLAGLLVAVAAASAVGAFALPVEHVVLALALLAGSGMVVFAAIVAAGPVLVRALAASLGRLVAAVGRAPGRLATANATQVPRRTAATISVLALGVGLTSSLLVALDSGEQEARRNLDALLPAAVALAAPDPAALAARLDADPLLVVVATDATTVYVDPAAGISEATTRQALDAALGGEPGVTVQYASEVRAEVDGFALILRLIGLALVGMTMLVAVVGVAVTLMLSVTERVRETGLLRAVGLTRRGVRAMVAWEAALSGAGAAVLGALIGALYGVLGTWLLDVGGGFEPSSLTSLGLLAAGVLALAVLAATFPAARAGRVAPVRALGELT